MMQCKLHGKLKIVANFARPMLAVWPSICAPAASLPIGVIVEAPTTLRMPFEVLNFAFVLLGCFAIGKCSEILAPAGLLVGMPSVDAVFATF
jgi:hypothetical protein